MLILLGGDEDSVHSAKSIFGIIAICFMVFVCCFPFNLFYRYARVEVLEVLLQIVIAPFGKVRFKHFFLANLLILLSYSFKDAGYVFCFYFRGYWINSEFPEKNDDICPHLENYTLIVVFIPLWFRFA
jgi:hypothetical protein